MCQCGIKIPVQELKFLIEPSEIVYYIFKPLPKVFYDNIILKLPRIKKKIFNIMLTSNV